MRTTRQARRVQAVDAGDVAEVRMLLEAGVSATARTFVTVRHKHEAGHGVAAPLLWTAAYRDPSDLVSMLIAHNAAVDELAPLLIASEYGSVSAMRTLIAGRANVNFNTDGACSALRKASERGHLEVVCTLLDAHADLLVLHNAVHPLFIAAEIMGHAHVVDLLLVARGADVDHEEDEEGLTALLLGLLGAGSAQTAASKPLSRLCFENRIVQDEIATEGGIAPILALLNGVYIGTQVRMAAARPARKRSQSLARARE